MKRISRLFFLLPLLALALAGCATEGVDKKESVVMEPPKVERPEFLFHRVMAGETMATIAKWYSGKESEWRELAEHNPDLSPWRLKIGDVVKVPVEMAVVHNEQPDHSTAPRKRKTPPQGTSPTVEQPDEEYFGPK